MKKFKLIAFKDCDQCHGAGLARDTRAGYGHTEEPCLECIERSFHEYERYCDYEEEERDLR